MVVALVGDPCAQDFQKIAFRYKLKRMKVEIVSPGTITWIPENQGSYI